MEYLVTEGYRWKWTRCTSSLQRNWRRVEGDGLRSGVFDFYLQSKGRNEPLTPVAVGVLVPLLTVGVNSSFCLFRLIFEHRLLHLNNFFFFPLGFMRHYCAVMMTSDVPTKFFLWWELQVLKMRGRLTRLEVCVSVGWLWENCWGSYLNLSFGSSRVCRCLRSDGGLRENESCYSLLDLLACGFLQSGQIRTFLWSTDLMTHARPFGLIISVLWASMLKCPIGV